MTELVAISNGFGQFHLARLAEGLARRGELGLFVTGAYPGLQRRSQTSPAALQRLRERRIDVPDRCVHSAWLAELPHQLGQAARQRGHTRVADRLGSIAFSSYKRSAENALRGATGCGVYHYRAGLGGDTVSMARTLGMRVVCDHSIAHPDFLQGMGLKAEHGIWEHVRSDLGSATSVLVNSSFVKQTCVEAGLAEDRIWVAHTPIGDDFLSLLDAQGQHDLDGAPPLVAYASTVERRKGADSFLAASQTSRAKDALHWVLVGDWATDMADLRRRVPPHVKCKSKLQRRELAALLTRASVFVLPSRAEGSARVVGEALAAGCWVVCTPETGSVVRDGIDGRIVHSEDVQGIANAIDEYQQLDSAARASQRLETARYARVRLSQEGYVSEVSTAYSEILA